MPAPTNTLLIEGTQEELSLELAQFIDGLRKDASPIHPDIASAINEEAKWKDQAKKEDALKKLVGASSVLNSAPERGMRLIAKPSYTYSLEAFTNNDFPPCRNNSSLQSSHLHRSPGAETQHVL
jgi:hypothetical protein